MNSAQNKVISFGSFRLLTAQQVLLEGDTPVMIGGRARDILAALTEKPGQVLSKEELIARVWPDTNVEEGNLKVHVAALRRALGDGLSGNRFVSTVHGRGYCFVAPLSVTEGVGISKSGSGETGRVMHLPPPLHRMVGRADVVRGLVGMLKERRFVTIAGGGGIGKTTVALAVAEALRTEFSDGITFVDLAPIMDPALVPGALAATLDLAVHTGSPLSGLTTYLKDRNILILLDSCEHVIEAAAILSETLFKGAQGVHILATSREPLGADGERVHRLSPLALPPQSAGLTSAEALTFPAVELFVERAASRLDSFELNDADAPFVADICRNLDGIALAIEIVAGRLDAFGLRGVAAQLDGRFRLLARGRRTALPRHQTLSATLDWSYEFLPEVEQRALRRLAIFSGGFVEPAAIAVLASNNVASWHVIDIVANLFAKSLITVDLTDAEPIYRLLETTRAYAFEKLVDSGEVDDISRRHAQYHRELFEGAELEWDELSTEAWLSAYGRHIDGVRAALDWAYSTSGDVQIGVALTVAAIPLWMQLSLADECRRRAEEALAHIATQLSRESRVGMKLYSALGVSLLFTKGAAPETHSALKYALSIAEILGDTDAHLRALWGLWADRQNNGVFNEGLVLAKSFKELAAGSKDSADVHIGDRMIGASLHFLGHQTEAREHIERMLASYVAPVRRSHLVRFQFDQKATANITLARALWLQGFAESSMRTLSANIEYALSINHTLSLCNALAQAACPVALLSGDLDAAEHFTELLIHYTAGNRLDVWHAYGRGCRGVLLVKRGDLINGLPLLGAAVDDLRDAHFVQFQTAFIASLAEGLASAGEPSSGLAIIAEALTQIERTNERWSMPELLRIKGDILLAVGELHGRAEPLFIRSMDMARDQGALAWELRSAVSLARLKRDQGKSREGRKIVASVYGRFTEGFKTHDLRDASLLLEELAQAPAIYSKNN
jgi:predicted ATPase/DNA-binding winged helix-turn-helix (wHTH) protein